MSAYLVAIAATLLTLFIRLLLDPLLGEQTVLIVFAPAVLVTTLYGGGRPGLFATALCTFAADYFVLPPRYSFRVSDPHGDIALILFILVALGIVWVGDRQRQAEARAGQLVEQRERLLGSEQGARAEAERVNRAKDEVLAMVAHELRQPLGAMLAAVEVLRLQLGPKSLTQAGRSLDVFERQVRHLERLVTDLSDASRVVRGDVTLSPRPVDLLDVLRTAVDSVRPRADERHQRITVTLPKKEIVLNADSDRLQQVFLNVLSNAVKYTPASGRIAVRVAVNESQAIVSIWDSGDGIRASDLERIFDLFTRAEGSHERGFGIGLAVARSIVQLHGGAIEAHSAGPGRGSEFVVTLPVYTSVVVA